MPYTHTITFLKRHRNARSSEGSTVNRKADWKKPFVGSAITPHDLLMNEATGSYRWIKPMKSWRHIVALSPCRLVALTKTNKKGSTLANATTWHFSHLAQCRATTQQCFFKGSIENTFLYTLWETLFLLGARLHTLTMSHFRDYVKSDKLPLRA